MARVRLTRIMLVAAAIEAVGFAANAAITSFTDETENSLLRWSLPAVVAVGVAMAQAGADAGRDQIPPSPPQSGRGARRGTPLAVAILVVVLVIGAGGFAVAVGARHAAGWITAHQEPIADRLVEPVAGSVGPVTVSVVDVVETRDFTHVVVEATNRGMDPVELFLGSECILASPGGVTLHADPLPMRNASRISVPGAAARQRETIVFPGHLEPDATSATLAFSNVWRLGPPLGSLTLELPLLQPPTPDGDRLGEAVHLPPAARAVGAGA